MDTGFVQLLFHINIDCLLHVNIHMTAYMIISFGHFGYLFLFISFFFFFF